MNRTINLVVAFAIFMITGCEKVNIEQKKVETGTPSYVELNKTYTISNSLSFRIDSLHDSRCPLKFECFWQGNVGLYFHITNNNTPVDTLINFLMPGNNPFYLANHKWQVLEVLPLSDHGEKIDMQDYKVNLLITKQ